jgi:hypothetical protein
MQLRDLLQGYFDGGYFASQLTDPDLAGSS